MPAPKTTLLLGGFMGAGKSTVGAVVAQKAGVSFVDLDVAIAARAKLSVPEIFRQRGEAGFRALEAATLDDLVAADGARVIALGGGALLERTRRLRTLERAFVVTLDASAEALATRLAPLRVSRPLLAGGDLASRVDFLVAARAAAYAECHARVRTDDASPDVVADRVLAVWRSERVPIPLGERTYTARFEGGACGDALAAAATELAPTSIVLVTDANVAPLWAAPADALRWLGSRGRRASSCLRASFNKRLATVEAALAEMIAAGADRRSVVVALGGGVASDMAGFAASVYLRGVRWICVPTTLLAMVDASVGGKTGVDLGAAKNAVGAFHQPSAVVVDPAHVATQAPRDYASGLAEVVKAALVGDAGLLDRLEREVDRVAVAPARRRAQSSRGAAFGSRLLSSVATSTSRASAPCSTSVTRSATRSRPTAASRR